MLHEIVAQPTAAVKLHITRAHVGQALRALRLSAQYNSRELNAVNRAALNLEACVWQWDGANLVIESATRLGTTYHVSHTGCTCQAGQRGLECWHMAAFILLQRASELATGMIASRRAYTEADYDELYA